MTLDELLTHAADLAWGLATADPDEDADALDLIAQGIDAWELDAGGKAQAYRYVSEALAQRADYLSDEAKRIDTRARRIRDDAARVKERLGALLATARELTGKASIDTPDGGKAWLQRTRSARVEVSDGADLPDEYLVTTTRPDLRTLRDDLKAGVVVDGVSLVESESEHVRWSR